MYGSHAEFAVAVISRCVPQAERDPEFRSAVCSLVPMMNRVMAQNNTVDVYERYFEEATAEDIAAAAPDVKGLTVFKDPHAVDSGGACNRTAVSVGTD